MDRYGNVRRIFMTHFKGKQFKEDIIMIAVGYYLRYNLSYPDISDLLISCTSIVTLSLK